MNLAALALLSSLALGAAPSSQRISVLLVPLDQNAESVTVRLEAYMNEALDAYTNTQVKTSDQAFGVPGDEVSEQSLRRAELGYAESKAAYEGKRYEDAERKLRATTKEYKKAAAAMKGCDHLCDTLAMYAAVLHKRGEVDEARYVLLDLIALEPTKELTAKSYEREFLSFRGQVATSRNAAMRGNATVKTRPGGSRVYLDGAFMGYTPITLNSLPIGKHLLRVERPGFKLYGELLEVTPEDVETTATLEPTASFRAFDAQMDNLANEIAQDRAGPGITTMGKSLALDRGLVGTVKEVRDNGGLEVNIALFEIASGKRLGIRRVAFQGDEYGQLKSEVVRVMNQLLNNVDGIREKKSTSTDPLDHRAGTEEWNAEDRGGKSTIRDKKLRKSTKDPLDTSSGTEDW